MTATESRTWQGQRAREARERAVRDEIAQAAGPLAALVRQCLADTGDAAQAVLLLAARLDLHTAPAIEPPHARPYIPQMSERLEMLCVCGLDSHAGGLLSFPEKGVEMHEYRPSNRPRPFAADRTQGPVLR